MKTCFLIILLFSFLTSCTRHDGYTLTGNVPKAWEGKPVYLKFSDINTPRNIDSTTVSKGKFEFKGKFEIPRECNVVIYLDPNNRQDRNQIVYFPLFIDSTAITATCDYSGQKPQFIITGSSTQDAYQTYLDQLQSFEAERKAAFSQYTQAFYYGDDHDKALELAKEVTQKANVKRQFQMQYIEEHPESVISLAIARGLCDRNSTLSLADMEKLFKTLTPDLQNSEMGKSFRELIQQKQVFLGQKYIDKELIATDGSPKKISDFIKPGHYTLIEFWASWCHPCRSEFPHVRRAYEKYHPKGFEIINISIDSEQENWLQALEEEKLPWASQLRDHSRSRTPEASAFRAYNLTGVPSSILLDDKGNIINFNARGGWLDIALQEIYD